MKILSPLKIVIIAAFLLCSINSYAQNKGRFEPSLVINGTPVDNAVRTIDNKTFVDLDVVTKLLNVTVNKTAGVIVLENKSKAPEVPAGPTMLYGNLSFYFNDHYKSKPDAGAKVYLIDGTEEFLHKPDDLLFPLTKSDTLILLKPNKDKKEFAILYSTIADGNGHYEFKAVKPGKYYFIAMSANVTGESKFDFLSKILIKRLNIQLGTTTDISHDFGVTHH